MRKSNKVSPPRDTRLHRMVRYLRERMQRPGRIVSGEMLRGASYSLGSCAVSVVVFWLKSRY